MPKVHSKFSFQTFSWPTENATQPLTGLGSSATCLLVNWSKRKCYNSFYYTTKLLGGLIQKIHQSDYAIAGLIFSKYQTGSVRIRPEIELFRMADVEEIEVCKLSPRNTKQFLSRRRRPPIWAWFGHVKQSGKTRGSCWTWKRRSQYEQQLSFKILSKNTNPI